MNQLFEMAISLRGSYSYVSPGLVFCLTLALRNIVPSLRRAEVLLILSSDHLQEADHRRLLGIIVSHLIDHRHAFSNELPESVAKESGIPLGTF